MQIEHFDVLIVGAGLSGIGAAVHLQDQCPNQRYAILEGRERSGGTWDLFNYPGVRSDSDMHTLGYAFKPWLARQAIADGSEILKYIRETAAENNVEQHIRYNHPVETAAWCSNDGCWTVKIRQSATEVTTLTANYLFMCSGYYNYKRGYTPDFKGIENFTGQIVHPQHWPHALDYTDKKIVVIGSGATAVTLVPELARQAAQVTMLQRSPTYMVSRPAEDRFANRAQQYLPAKWAYALTRWKNVTLGLLFFTYCQKYPNRVAKWLIQGVADLLPVGTDVKRDFTPSYNPWDQRLCLVPDADMFNAINQGKANVVTDHIDEIMPLGIKLKSGRLLSADLIVTATGLDMQLFGGMEVYVDGKLVNMADSLTYKGMMFSDMPNFVMSMGYTNASWTLKSDLTSAYFCRLLNYMTTNAYTRFCPRREDRTLKLEPFMDFSSGYVQRARARLPKQASTKPWRLNQNYFKDLWTLGFGPLTDQVMEFRGRDSNSESVR